MGTMIVTLNGTNENRWHKFNLRQNPFPQIPKAELQGAMMQLNSLDGDPLEGPDEIAKRLAGWNQEFIDGCIERFVPGERVSFKVSFPERIG